MVSRFQRHLSLFLVVVLAMGWLVVPVGARGQNEEDIDEALGFTAANAPVAGDSICKTGVDATTLFTQTRILTSLPPFAKNCFEIVNNSLVHHFHYEYDPAARDNQTVQILKYTIISDKTVFAGCDNGIDLSKPCAKSDPSTYNFFSLDKTYLDKGYDEAIHRRESYSDVTVKLYQLPPAINNNIGDVTFPFSRTVLPSDLFLVASDQWVYGFYAKVSDPKGNRLQLINPGPDISAYKGDIGNPLARPIWHYVAIMNGLYPTFTRPHEIGNAPAATGLADLRKAARETFGQLKNDINTSLTKGGGDIDLIDDPIDNKATATDSTGNVVSAPLKPPQLILSGAKLHTADNWTLTLKYNIRSPEVAKGRNNNYFLFVFNHLTDEQKNLLTQHGITDPNNIFIAVDGGGNIGFLVEDKTKKGGLFATGKDRLDPGDEADFVAFGRFDGSNVQQSHNANGEVLNINLEQYRKIITRRVYNNPDLSRLITFGCDPTPVLYPSLNNGYEKIANFPKQIPLDVYRKCINEDPGGWLKKWGVTDTRIDQAPEDDCIKSFGTSFFTTIAGKMICGFINTMIGAATWMAGFSIEFLIQAIGLQTGP